MRVDLSAKIPGQLAGGQFAVALSFPSGGDGKQRDVVGIQRQCGGMQEACEGQTRMSPVLKVYRVGRPFGSDQAQLSSSLSVSLSQTD